MEAIDLSEPLLKRMKLVQELRVSQAKMDDLPDLPFEKILGYLPLEDCIRSIAVSRRWYRTINSFRVKSLCFSDLPVGFIFEKRRLVSGEFARNFISSPRFGSFFSTFGQSILASLKHLRLCDFYLDKKNVTALTQILSSFSRLEDLNIIRLNAPSVIPKDSLSYPYLSFGLNLPMLTSIELDEVFGITKLTLDAPGLQKVKHWRSDNLEVNFVHTKSVKRLVTDETNVMNLSLTSLTSLQYLYLPFLEDDSTLLYSLRQLKEIHLCSGVSNLFEQKRRYRCDALQIYLHGVLLNGPADPQIDSDIYIANFDDRFIAHFGENLSRLADEIPFICQIFDIPTKPFAVESAIKVLKRFTNLNEIMMLEPVQDIGRFLDVLKGLDNIVNLNFFGDQPQELLDRLRKHSSVQKLRINCTVSDFKFIFHLKNLTTIETNQPIDAETILKILDQLKYLSRFSFWYLDQLAVIEIDYRRRFNVEVNSSRSTFTDPNAAFQFVVEILHWRTQD